MKRFFSKVAVILIAILGVAFYFGHKEMEKYTNNHPESLNAPAVEIIEDAEQFSRISEKKLEKLMGGKPSSVEKWTNKLPGKEYKVKTLSYDKNKNHYEFIVYKGKVVRLSIYSENYWTNNGNRFSIDRLADIPKSYGITLSDLTVTKVNNNITYRLGLVNEKVVDFDVQDIKDKTYGFVKITYDMKCFE